VASERFWQVILTCLHRAQISGAECPTFRSAAVMRFLPAQRTETFAYSFQQTSDAVNSSDGISLFGWDAVRAQQQRHFFFRGID
jgi:hypothetical protein